MTRHETARERATAKSKRPRDAKEATPAKAVTPSVAGQRWWAAGGVAAAMLIAVIVNILGARHYKRWDWTQEGLYTLSPATGEILARLQEPVEVYLLLSRQDPLTLTLRHLLDGYRSHTNQLRVKEVDPDRNPAEFMAVQQQYGISALKSADGRIIADAAIIVAKGDQRQFITPGDLFEVEAGAEMKARPRVERVLTDAIRRVVSGDKPQICFTTGHGEASLDTGGVEGLLALQIRLTKTNYQVEQLAPLRDLTERDPIAACKLVILAGPSRRLPLTEVQRLMTYLQDGGNVLVFSGPELDESGEGLIDVGLAPLLALGGARKNNDLVFELDPARRWPIGQGEALMAQPVQHAITEGFVAADGAVNVMLTFGSSLSPIESAAVRASPLLMTSPAAFGMSDFIAWAKERPTPEAKQGDLTGPIMLAFAAELPKTRAAAPHGPRMVVFGTKSAVVGGNWTNERLRGTSLLVESAISWLTATPSTIDIPPKEARSLGAGLTEEALRAAAWRLILALPLASVLLGVAVHLQRRRSDRRAPERRS